jgi:glycosyltransferase involved in cell wall biosynthesis
MTTNARNARFVKTHSRNGSGPVVVQVLPALVRGGVERGTIEMARAIIDAGGRAVVISEGGPLVRHLDRIGAIHHTLAVARKNPLVWGATRRKLRRLLQTEGADIVHVRSRVPAWIAVPAARSLGLITVSTVHGRFQNSNVLKRLVNGKMLAADHVIAISKYVRQQIERQFGDQGKKLSVVPRGVDVDMFDPASVSQSRIIRFVDSVALPEDEPVIMLPARPSAWKGHEVLLKALARISDRKFNCVLVGAADGKSAFVDRLTTLGMKLGLVGRFRLTHGVDDMPAALMAADIVVMPSVTPEPFGRVSLEAQAMGRLVVAFDHGGAAESIIHGRTGWLATPVDLDSLAECLATALDMTVSQRRTMAVETRQHIEDKFSTQQMCNRTIAIYARLLKARHAKAGPIKASHIKDGGDHQHA